MYNIYLKKENYYIKSEQRNVDILIQLILHMYKLISLFLLVAGADV